MRLAVYCFVLLAQFLMILTSSSLLFASLMLRVNYCCASHDDDGSIDSAWICLVGVKISCCCNRCFSQFK